MPEEKFYYVTIKETSEMRAHRERVRQAKQAAVLVALALAVVIPSPFRRR